MNTNKSLKHQFIITLIFAILNLLLIACIFIHSLTPAEISQEESGAVTGWLSYIFPFELDENIVRKLAHFIEFSALGIVTSLTVYSYCQRAIGGIFFKLFVCLATAVCDEAIQLNVAGRSGQVSDILLDFSGCLFGLIITTIVIVIVIYLKRKRLNRNGKS
ncbi:MAG: VanZ family protein [Ruminococcus sp.]